MPDTVTPDLATQLASALADIQTLKAAEASRVQKEAEAEAAKIHTKLVNLETSIATHVSAELADLKAHLSGWRAVVTVSGIFGLLMFFVGAAVGHHFGGL